MSETFEKRQLYGGAIEIDIPRRFIDVTSYRHIPDHQELFSDEKSDQSVIIELNEFQDHISNANAIKHHYEVLVEDAGISTDKSVILNFRELTQAEMPNFDASIPKYVLLAQQKIAKFNETAENTINIYMALVRLEKSKTDLLITFNEAIALAPTSSSVAVVQNLTPSNDQSKSEQLFLTMLKSFKIKDYSLFVHN
ncbi:Ran GTPase binding protein [Dictyostelium discoideum AX4]|uniref:Probable ran guanine nucleotide release factor n=1 Tax=Dictyostelium discoideum TaxID=44689 RepID=MOG1_DICDI|nr:Ran GTPase binding protein [Dictyostelium discoideum AX4]Q54ML6.1 RecName: Full=Probable ran guanine nucleotide release factor; Short=RanGNRF [Dictyostelium discoideum]EAL64470.1 Ran GTPase binding protein [Dictyostelium discoideum AX4]|eukprot:XP_637974.1 Ran GTPase binding protein [Dictyostelium discoideum AX4]